MNLQLLDGIFKPEAHPLLIKSVSYEGTLETIGIVYLENDFDYSRPNYQVTTRYLAGYYVFSKRGANFLSATRYDTLDKASEAFNQIYTMFNSI